MSIGTSVVPYLAPQPGQMRPSWIDVLDKGQDLAEVIANTDFVPRGLRGNQPAILAAILYGHEVGLEPMQSLAKIAVIDGKPSLAAEAQRALILAAGHELWLEESTVTRAVWAGRRRGSKQTTRVTWTLDDAKRARIGGKQNWQSYPRQMLSARASAELARAVFADVIGGMAATEELDDFGDEPSGTADTSPPAAPSRRRRRPAAAEVADTATAAPDPAPAGADAEPTQPQPPVEQAEPRRSRRRPQATTPPAEPVEPAPADAPSEQAMRKLFAMFKEKGIGEREDRLAFSNQVLGRTIASSTELTGADVSAIIDALNDTPDGPLPQREQEVVGTLEAELDAQVDDRPPLPDDEPA